MQLYHYSIIIFKCSASRSTGMLLLMASLSAGMNPEYMTGISDSLLIIRFNSIIILRMDSHSSSDNTLLPINTISLNIISEHDVQTDSIMCSHKIDFTANQC